MPFNEPHPPDRGWWLLVTVKKPGFSRQVFDAYYKVFQSTPRISATEQLVEWWYSLPPDSFTRDRAIVQTHWCVDSADDLIFLVPNTADDFLRMHRG